MAGSPAIPADVARFVAANIETLEQLELLLLLVQAPDRWWDATTVADTLSIPTDTARQALDHFAMRNLLAIRITGDLRYQFQPGEPRLGDAARAVVETFRVNRLGILRLVARQDRRSIRDFADAFRIRRDDDR